MKNNISKIKEEALNSAIKKIKKQLEKDKEFCKLKKLNSLIKHGEI